MLGEAERAELLGYRGERLAPATGWVPGWIVSRAERAPGDVAVECGGEELSYGDLERRSRALAARLRGLGAGRESRVGLCAPRSVDLVVGVLGILRSGAAYVPLDPEYPEDRLSWMVEDSDCELLVSTREVADRLPSSAAERVWLEEVADDDPEEWSEEEPFAEQLAYVIYTSGSTGRPKGVGVSHGNLRHSTWARRHRYGDSVGGFAVVSSLSFDSSVAGLFWTLTNGGRLWLPSEGSQRDVLSLASRIGRGGITHLLCLPSLYGVLLESGEELGDLGVVIVAGEACPPDLPGRHRARLGEAALYNEYGPTEGTVWSTVWEAPPGDWQGPSVPIGRAVAEVDVWVVESSGDLAPVGVGGEIELGGGGLARGYLGRPALTAERFVPDGFSGVRGGRLYRTGDRGRWSETGELEFLGRADKQVKLRGYRIELGEVEAALSAHRSVAEAVVVLREAGVQGAQLVGYWRGAPAAAVGEGELESWLQQRLPGYMVPSVLVEVSEWPRTPNGKLDEAALPAPEAASGNGGAPARGAVEEVVAAVWADVLGSEREPGREDSFFALGGHSLLATQVISRLRSTFQVDLTLPQLFAAPTVAGLARQIERLRPGSAAAAPPLVAGRRPDPLPLSYAQQRLWFLDQMHPGNPFYNVNTAVRLEGELSVAALERALAAVVERHESLRTRFPVRDGQPVQEIGDGRDVHLEQVDLGDHPPERREAEARERLRAAAERPFDLAQGPLLRALLLRLGSEDHRLQLTLHHIVTDAWSMGSWYTS